MYLFKFRWEAVIQRRILIGEEKLVSSSELFGEIDAYIKQKEITGYSRERFLAVLKNMAEEKLKEMIDLEPDPLERAGLNWYVQYNYKECISVEHQAGKIVSETGH